MKQKGLFLRLLLIFLGLSYVLSSVAIPLSRSFVVEDEDPSLQEIPEEQESMTKQDAEKYLEMLDEDGEVTVHGRMVTQSDDYPAPGANNHHEPKPPAKV